MILTVCQKNYEKHCLSEISRKKDLKSAKSQITGEGLILWDSTHETGKSDFLDNLSTMIFPHAHFLDIKKKGYEQNEKIFPVLLPIIETFLDSIRKVRFDQPWLLRIARADGVNPVHWINGKDPIYQKIRKFLKSRVSRIEKLATHDLYDLNRQENTVGNVIPCFIAIITEKIYYSFHLLYSGQKRMVFDQNSPSRSYLKLEEAFYIFNRCPMLGETVYDLGSAPGGWSYCASKYEAIVYSIDNGDLKGGAANNSNIIHLKEDAFKLVPQFKGNWLLCDMIEKPEKIIKLIKKWMDNRWFDHLIINLKIGYSDPFTILSELEKYQILQSLKNRRLLHLFHDREEITLMGSLK